MLENIMKNIARHRTKSVLTIVISFLIVLFFFVYLSGLLGNINELDSLPENLPVEGKITSKDGTLDEDIRIGASKVQKLEKTGAIKDVTKDTILYFDIENRVLDDDEATMLQPQEKLLGINTSEAFTDLNKVSYIEGYSDKVFSGKEAVCIVEEGFMSEHNLNLGDSYKSTLYRKKYKDADYTYEIIYVGALEARIVGTFTINLSDMSNSAQVLAPMQYIREIYRETDTTFSVHSMRFTLADPFDMNSFKKQAREIGFEPRDPLIGGVSHKGEAMVLYDESFIKTSEQLQKNISLMRIFAPLVFLIVAFIGFLVSYLLMQSRQNEFAIMRSLGTKKNIVFATALLESLVLSFIGGIIGTILGVIVLGISMGIALIILPVFIVLYMLGTLAALILLNKFSVMEVLTKTD